MVNNSYRKIWKLQGNQCCVVKLMLYLNEVLTFTWWLCHEHFFFDWLLKVGKVYLHWSHRMDLRLCAISFEFGNIYLDGFHMIDRKRFRILWTVNLFLLFLVRTHRAVIFLKWQPGAPLKMPILFLFILGFLSDEVASDFKHTLSSTYCLQWKMLRKGAVMKTL